MGKAHRRRRRRRLSPPQNRLATLEPLEFRYLMTATLGAAALMEEQAPFISVVESSGTFADAPFAATTTINGAASLESVTPTLTYFSGTSATGSPLPGAPITVGTYTVLASFAGSADYASAAASTTFAISQATPTFSGPPSGTAVPFLWPPDSEAAWIAGVGAESTPATSLEGVTPTVGYYSGSVATGSPLSGMPSTAGTYTALASFIGSTDYTTAAASVAFTISATSLASPTLAITDLGGTYSGSPFPATDEIAGIGSQSNPAGSLEGVTPTLTYYSGFLATGTGLSAAPSTAGVYTALASFAGSTDYTTAAASVCFTIAQAVPTLTVTDAGGTYNDAAFPAAATFNGSNSLEGITPVLAYYSGTSASGSATGSAPSQAGTYTAVASFFGSADYTTAAASTTFTIAPATATLYWSHLGGVYDGEPQPVLVSSVGPGQASPAIGQPIDPITPTGLTITYYSGTAASGAPLSGAPLYVGTYTALASFAGSTDYTSLAASATFSITLAVPTLSVTDLGGTYDLTPFPATDEIAGVGAQSIPAGSLEGVTPTLTYYSGANATGMPLSSAPATVGTYTAVASFAGSTDYSSAVASTTFGIVRDEPELHVFDGSGVYSSEPFTAYYILGELPPPGTMLGPGPPTDRDNTIEGVPATLSYFSGTATSGSPLSGAPSAVGTYTVVANFPGSSDYTSAVASTTFTIFPTSGTPVVSVTALGGSYSGHWYGATATVDNASSLEGVTPTLTYYSGASATGTALSGAPSAAGTYAVLASFAGSTDYGMATASVSFTIAQAAATLIVTDAGGISNGTSYPATAELAVPDNQSSASLEGVTPGFTYYSGTGGTGMALSSAPSSAGTYTVVASFAGSADYTSAAASTTFSITPPAPTLSVADLGGTYADAAFPATATVDGAAGLEGVTPTLSYYSGTSASGTALSGAPSAAGTYTVVASFAGSTDYQTTAASQTFTITQAVPTLIVSSPIVPGVSDGDVLVGGASNAAPATALVAGVGGQSSAAPSLEGVTPTITYYSGNSATGTPLGGVPSLAGTYTALANFAGSADYTSAAASVSFTITAQVVPITTISPLDVLILIDYLNEYGPGPVPPNSQIGAILGWLGTDQLAPVDVLGLINYLNQNPSGITSPIVEDTSAVATDPSPAVAGSSLADAGASAISLVSSADIARVALNVSGSVSGAATTTPTVGPAVMAVGSASTPVAGSSTGPTASSNVSVPPDAPMNRIAASTQSDGAPADAIAADALFSKPADWWRGLPPTG